MLSLYTYTIEMACEAFGERGELGVSSIGTLLSEMRYSTGCWKGITGPGTVSVIGELWRSLSSEGKRQILCEIGRSVRKGEWQEGYFAGRGLPKCVLLGGKERHYPKKRKKQTDKQKLSD